jgi:predicted ATPase/DNA-binding SARP family transcriptional activator
MLSAALLGQFRILLNDQPVQVASRPAQVLLAYLLVNPAIGHRREQLAGMLWPDFLASSARKNLRNAIWQLRRALGDEYLIAGKDTIAFNTDAPYQLDISQLQDKAAASDSQALMAAVSVYRGELLPGFYDDWVLLERERLRGLFESRMHTLLDRLAAESRWAEAQVFADHWIAQGQVPEPAYRALMMAAAARGDLAGTAATYRRCVQALKVELDVAPSAETHSLFERLSSGQLQAAPSPDSQPPATAPHSPVEPPPAIEGGMQTGGAAVYSPDASRQDQAEAAGLAGLPLPPAPFVGRERELAELRQVLLDPAYRLVTLVGPGGIGKTRLALETVAAVRRDFEHDICFVPLAALSSPDQLVSAIVERPGFRAAPNPDPKQQLLNYVRKKQLLLVLDNVEHLLDGVDLIGEILAAAPGLKVLAISRERMNVTGEVVYALGGMAVPPATSGANPLAYGAVQLLMQRARLVRADLHPGDYDLEAIARICQLVEGMPLAIVLAASWLEVLSFREIADEIGHNLDFLEGQLRDLPARQRSVRATFEYSWRRLSPAEQRTFARVSVLHGGFTRQAAQAIAGAQIGELLTLANKSLLSVGERQRYQVHELLRQFSYEQLQQLSEADEYQNRHLVYYLNLAETAAEAMRGPEQYEWLNRLEDEHNNLRAALRWATSAGQAAAAERLCAALWWLWDNHGHYREGRRWAEMALATGEGGAPTVTPAASLPPYGHHARARTLLGAGILAWLQGDHTVAHEQLSESLTLAAAGGDAWCQAYALCRLGRLRTRSDDLQGARDLAEKSLAIFAELGDDWGMSRPLRDLGIIELCQGQLEAGRAHLEDALARRRTLHDWEGVGDALMTLGDLHWVAGRPEQATVMHAEAASIFRELPNPASLGNSLIRLGFTTHDEGKTDESAARFAEGLAIVQELLSRDSLATALLGVARLALTRGDAEKAGLLFEAIKDAYSPLELFMHPYFQHWRDCLEADLLAALGETALAAARAAAQGLSQDQILAIYPLQ